MENEGPCKASFLDLSVEVHDRKFTTNLFDKDAFPFYINCMHCLGSNIPSKIFYAAVDSQIFSIARTTTDLINMVMHVNLLLILMKKQDSKGVSVISLLHVILEKFLKCFIS